MDGKRDGEATRRFGQNDRKADRRRRAYANQDPQKPPPGGRCGKSMDRPDIARSPDTTIQWARKGAHDRRGNTMRKRKKDRDGLYKQPGSPNWYGSYTDAAGGRRRRSTGTDNRKKAEAILSKWKTEAHQGRCAGERPVRTLHSLMLAYIDAHGHKRSLERDGYSIQHIYRLIGEARDVAGITAADIATYQQERRQEGAAPATINKEIGVLSTAMNWARRSLGWKIENAAAGKRCQEPAPRSRWLTHAEAARLLDTAGESDQAPHLEDFIRLALHTGMRSGEILGLEWRRVDLGQSRVLLEAEDQKSGRPGVVPLNQEARTALLSRARFRAEHCPGSHWVFCDRHGRRIASIKKSFAAAVRRAGIDHCTPHDLRRTFGSWLVQAGAPIQQVSKLLRHSDIRVTDQVYAHLAPEQLHDAVARLDSHSMVIAPAVTSKKIG